MKMWKNIWELVRRTLMGANPIVPQIGDQQFTDYFKIFKIFFCA
jgi:hypothetical protein